MGDKNASLPKFLQRFWHHISSRRRSQLVFVFVLMILAAIAEVLSIGAVIPFLGALMAPERIYDNSYAQPFIQLFHIEDAKQLLLPFTIFFCVAALLSGVLRLVLVWAQTRLSHAIGADISIDIYRRTLYQPYSVHVARNSSEVIAGVSIKANAVVNGITVPVLMMISSCLILIAILLTLLSIQPMVAFLSFAGFGGIYVFITLLVKKRLVYASSCINQESTQVMKALQEGLGGIRDVLIDGTQSTYCEVYRHADQLMRYSMANVQIISISPRFAIEALGMVLIAGLAYSLAIGPEGLSNSVPLLGALAIGAQRLLPVAQQIYASLAHIRAGRDFLADIINLLDQPLPSYLNAAIIPSIPFNKAIMLNGIGFRYTKNTPWVLKDLNFKIEKGSRVGFIGSTGSGKSTLLDIVMGLLLPDEGSLTIDDVKITPENYRAWQAQIAHVPQSIFLADTTVAENIAFGVLPDKIDMNRVREAARKAQIAHTIEALEKQYDTRVGERGIRLSGGQRQRIGIARALYKNVSVIVFDEATSALDNETERAVMEAIDGLDSDLTILMVAHRLTTLKNCTQIVELSNGRVGRTGSYQEIVNA